MPESIRGWKHLAPNPRSSYRQLFLKGTRIRAEAVYAWTVDGTDPSELLTAEQVAEEMSLPLEAVREAIEYCASDPPEIREDHAMERRLMEATGATEPNYRQSPTYRMLSLRERAGLGL